MPRRSPTSDILDKIDAALQKAGDRARTNAEILKRPSRDHERRVVPDPDFIAEIESRTNARANAPQQPSGKRIGLAKRKPKP